jgi:glycosyltransferase involved in cell wall biosynthesis
MQSHRSWLIFGSVPVAEPITIMHLRACNFVGGPEKQILEHFGRLDATRFTPVLGTFVQEDEDPLGEAASAQGFRSIRLQSHSPLNPFSIYQLFSILKQHKIDILCTHGYKPNILGCFAAALARIPTIAISRGWTWESPKIRFYESLDRLFLKVADHVIAVSAGQQAKILAAGIQPKKVSVIHNAINLEDVVKPTNNLLRQELGLPENALIIASAGRLSPEKNYATMLDVAQQICAQHGNTYFMVFGEGFLRPELEQKIETTGLQGRFLLPGFRKDLQSLLPDIDIFMLPSFTEGLPNVALEAFANKKPIVASAVGGTPEVVQHGVSGFLTTPEDVAGMVAGLQQLIADPGLRGKMGAAGYQYVAENFGFAAQTAIYEKLYEAVSKVRRH